jgi:DNA-binding transcriptional regulator YiaG
MLRGLGTSATPALPADLVARSPRPDSQTTSGAAPALRAPADAAIGELRRLTGLTWDQLSRLFGVSRRSVHFWASGKMMTPANEEKLQRVLAVVRSIDRGAAASNRALLLGVAPDGTLPFDLLVAGLYDQAMANMSRAPGAPVAPRPSPKVSDQVHAARSPRRPEDLVGALQDRIHREVGMARPARTVKVGGRDGKR